jgi:hypothetical protein
MRKVLVVDTVYHQALLDFEKSLPRNDSSDYTKAIASFFSSRFGTSDVYSFYLNNLSFESQTFIVNSVFLQSLWEKKFIGKSRMSSFSNLSNYATRLPIVGNFFGNLSPLHKILFNQVNYYKPEIIYFQDLNFVNPELLLKFKKMGILLIGQIASPLPNTSKLKLYDHIYSSLPNIVEDIDSLGIPSSFLPIGFDVRVLSEIEITKKTFPISFVGGISSVHASTIPLLEVISEKHKDLTIYGYGRNYLKKNKDLISKHLGTAWGLDMYKVIAGSDITLNRHSRVSKNYANNMRLFESTGVGTLLLTDNKSNLKDYFKVSEEVLAYDSPEDATEKIFWAFQNPELAKTIALEGQKRTLECHTYEKIINDLAIQLNQKV